MTNCRRSSMLPVRVGTLLRALVLGAALVLTQFSAAARALDLTEARQLYRAGKYDECAAAAAQAITDGYLGEDWPLLKIDADMQRGRYAEALQTLDAALQEFRSSVRLRWLGYQVLLHNNQLDRAEKMLDEIRELATGATYRYNDSANRVTLGKYFEYRGADARRVLDTFYDPVKKDQPELAEAYIAAGELALSKSDYALAADEFANAQKRRADDPDILFGLARAFAPSDDKRANESLQAALKLNADHVPSLLLVVDNHVDAERYDEADTILTHILEVNPFEPTAWSYRAVLAHLRGDEEAEKAAREKRCRVGRRIRRSIT